MKHYDFIIAGGGAAGLSLALRLARSPLRDRSILIVDQDPKDRDDRTFSFWTQNETFFDGIVQRSWKRLHFAGEGSDGRGFTQEVELRNYRYQMIRGLDFYRYAHKELGTHSNIEFILGKVSAVEDGPEQALVRVGDQTCSAQWVFDSITPPADRSLDTRRYHHMKLLFKGWVIETDTAAFDPHKATLMDFRTPQKGDIRFFYRLPYTTHQALVEYTLFTQTRPNRVHYETALQTYIENTVGIERYRILYEESGGLPVSDQPIPRQRGERVLAIGANGGMVKPTTGYAFTRIQRDSAAIVESLLTKGHPFAIPEGSRLYRALDAILLEVMATQGEQIKPVFTELFKNNPIERILRFLDEEASLIEVLSLMSSLQTGLFLRTLARSRKLQHLLAELPRNPTPGEAGSLP